MERNIKDTIDQIIGLLPDPSPPEIEIELIVLKGELRILRRTGSYTPPEASDDTVLWDRLARALYRYMPKPESYAFAQQISDLVQGK